MTDHTGKIAHHRKKQPKSSSHETKSHQQGENVPQNADYTDPAHLRPNEIMHLQRTLGNHAVLNLLNHAQRNPLPNVADQVLTPQQVARAKWFYNSRKHQYPPENVKKFQRQLGILPTGEINDPFILAVANFQHLQGHLAVDGMAGKNTIGALFPNGMLDYDKPEIVQSNEQPLSESQVVKALSFYAMRPDLYPPVVITKIQEQVGTVPTGKMNPESVQAVARFQKNDGTLAVDGMAGPRTMPAAFPTGLAKETSIESYAKASLETEEKWDSFADQPDPAEARADHMLAKVNEQLIKANVPPIKKAFKENLGAKAGFQFRTWELWINKKSLMGNAAETDIIDWSRLFYHEARHAEQHFHIARLLIGQGNSIDQTVERSSIPRTIVEKAKKIPIIPGTVEAVAAQGWFDSGQGEQGKNRNKVLTKIREAFLARKKARANLKKADEAHKQLNTPETQQALDEASKELEVAEKNFAEAEKDYRDLPREADAHRVSDKYEEVVGEMKKGKG